MSDRFSLCCGVRAIKDSYLHCFVCMKCLNSCQVVEEMEYDIFLGGPSEKYSVSRKRIIKESFPDLHIYDPEDYQGDDGFLRNYLAMKVSRSMFATLPDFPSELVPMQAGMYYVMHNHNDPKVRIDNLVILWTRNIVTGFPQGNFVHLGQVVETMEDGIARLKSLF